nr:MAG TPA: hypothetical protein [Caudoviricetes sp.]
MKDADRKLAASRREMPEFLRVRNCLKSVKRIFLESFVNSI